MIIRCKAAWARPYDSICIRCLARLASPKSNAKRRPFSVSPLSRDLASARPSRQQVSRRKYFSANDFVGRSGSSALYPAALDLPREEVTVGGVVQRQSTIRPQTLSEAAHEETITRPAPQQPASMQGKEGSDPVEEREPKVPLDASSRLSTLSSALPPTSIRRILTTYLSLAKPRLSFLIVLTTAAAYSLYPVPAVLLPSTTIAPSLSTLTLLFLTTGTALCCASANALNMLLEPQHDAKMSRTRNRPIVRGLIGKRGALIFAGAAGMLGIGDLWFGVNPTVAFLGALNIFLYAGVYTPMKRISVLNTWVGAIVGGIPPMMGWAAAAGQSAVGSGNWEELLLGADNVGGWLLAGLLFAWQMPHFAALSWMVREEYKNAGYRMLCWTNLAMNGRVALRYSLLLFPICAGLTWYGVTDQGFLLTSSAVNMWIVREAYRFWRRKGQKGSARGLFWASVWHLPVMMVLAMGHKKGLWEGIWRRIVGEEGDDDDVWMNENNQSAIAAVDKTISRPLLTLKASVT
ncbi:Protoheme IX farnesyltransferase, mitochondrial [Schaereria dolodes]|nr:Protoheme IX farnesyltransferase, mitochondrial [Schaereria dolodes]